MTLPLSSGESACRHLVLLAPAVAEVPPSFGAVRADSREYRRLMGGMQRLRGAVYLRDGAIDSSQLTVDGRHKASVDRRAWHLLVLNDRERVAGCARMLQHPNTVTFRNLTVRKSALARSACWGRRMRSAVEAELAEARRQHATYAEVGGWVLAEEVRHTTEALRTVLAIYALSQLCGGSFGISTATVRHHSSSILRRIGGASLFSQGTELPPYYDPIYKCEMELLRFDSRFPNPRYQGWIDEFKSHIGRVPVIYSRAPDRDCRARAMSNRSM